MNKAARRSLAALLLCACSPAVAAAAARGRWAVPVKPVDFRFVVAGPMKLVRGSLIPVMLPGIYAPQALAVPTIPLAQPVPAKLLAEAGPRNLRSLVAPPAPQILDLQKREQRVVMMHLLAAGVPVTPVKSFAEARELASRMGEVFDGLRQKGAAVVGQPPAETPPAPDRSAEAPKPARGEASRNEPSKETLKRLRKPVMKINFYAEKERNSQQEKKMGPLTDKELADLTRHLNYLNGLPDSEIPWQLLGNLEGVSGVLVDLLPRGPVGRDVAAAWEAARKLEAKVRAIPSPGKLSSPGRRMDAQGGDRAEQLFTAVYRISQAVNANERNPLSPEELQELTRDIRFVTDFPQGEIPKVPLARFVVQMEGLSIALQESVLKNPAGRDIQDAVTAAERLRKRVVAMGPNMPPDNAHSLSRFKPDPETHSLPGVGTIYLFGALKKPHLAVIRSEGAPANRDQGRMFVHFIRHVDGLERDPVSEGRERPMTEQELRELRDVLIRGQDSNDPNKGLHAEVLKRINAPGDAGSKPRKGAAPESRGKGDSGRIMEAVIKINDYLEAERNSQQEKTRGPLTDTELADLTRQLNYLNGLADSEIPRELLGHLEGVGNSLQDLLLKGPVGRDVAAAWEAARKLEAKARAVPGPED